MKEVLLPTTVIKEYEKKARTFEFLDSPIIAHTTDEAQAKLLMTIGALEIKKEELCLKK